MLFLARKPHPPLDRWVECLWLAECGPDYFGTEKIFPHGAAELIVNLSRPQRLLNKDDPSQATEYREAWVSGGQRSFLVVESTQDYKAVGIRFRPGGAYPFLRMPMIEFTDQVVELDQLWGRSVGLLRERLLEAVTPEAKFASIERFLLKLLRRERIEHRVVDYALARIGGDRNEGPFLIDDLIRELGVSSRHLRRLFQRHVGLGPKLVTRILAFQRVLGHFESAVGPRLTDISHLYGYYDQAHMIRDFKAFAGVSPSAFLKGRDPVGNSMLLD